VKPLEDLPNTFWCLMTKREKYQLKLEDPSSFVSSSVLSEKTGLSDFAQQNLYLSFHFLVTVDLRANCIV
jgi:hypothetical protein